MRVYGTGPVGSSVAEPAHRVRGRPGQLGQSTGLPVPAPAWLQACQTAAPPAQRRLPDASLPGPGPAGRAHLPRPARDPERPATPLGSGDPDGPPAGRASAARPGQRPDLAVLTGGYPAELPGELVASADRAPRGQRQRGDRRGRPAGHPRAVGLPGLRGSGPQRPRSGVAADPGPGAGRAASARRLRGHAGRRRWRPRRPAQALSFLDSARPAGAVTNGTLELVLPGWQWRRRSWARTSTGAAVAGARQPSRE